MNGEIEAALSALRSQATQCRAPAGQPPRPVAGWHAGAQIDAALVAHLTASVVTPGACQCLGERLIWANIAASCTAAFRGVEGSASDWGEPGEQAPIRRRAAELFPHAPWRRGTGWCEDDACGDWQRSAWWSWDPTSKGRSAEGALFARTEGL